jgi:hypothetical protein
MSRISAARYLFHLVNIIFDVFSSGKLKIHKKKKMASQREISG